MLISKDVVDVVNETYPAIIYDVFALAVSNFESALCCLPELDAWSIYTFFGKN